MEALLKLENLPSRPIEDGDAGVVLKREGGFYVFSTGNVDPDNLTPRQIEQAEIIQALAVALQIPAVMHVLKTMANDPKITGDQVLDTSAPKH